MLKRICLGVAALCLAGSLAARGEEAIGLRVEAGVDIGQLSAELLQDAGESFEWDALLIQPYVQVARFDEGLSFSARLRGTFSTEDDAEWLGADFDCSVDGFEFQGLVGWGIALPATNWKVIPLLGFTYHDFSAEFDGEVSDITYDFDSLTIDIGARVEGPLPVGDKFNFVGQLLVSPIIAGDSEVDLILGSVEDDLDGGFYLELRAGVDFKINDMINLHAAFIYETMGQKTGSDISADDDMAKYGIQLGVAFKF